MKDKKSIANIFSAQTANSTVQEALTIKELSELWGGYWMSNEVCCLFADSNVGKSVLAVQIGDHISRKLETGSVLYYDFELSKKQFGIRYTDPETNEGFKFKENFIRVELDTEQIKGELLDQLEDIIMEAIEMNITEYEAKVVIIDNISWLVNMKNSAATAGKLMQNLCLLKKKYDLSILVLAHTNKRNMAKPIDQNSMNGSKKFFNFFDSIFAIGKSIRDPECRYTKQLKVRDAAFEHDSDNVEVFKIIKKDAFLFFDKQGNSTEDAELGKEPAKITPCRVTTDVAPKKEEQPTKKVKEEDAPSQGSLDVNDYMFRKGNSGWSGLGKRLIESVNRRSELLYLERKS